MSRNELSEILIHINPTTFKVSQKGKIKGEIALKIDDKYFPELCWNDFVDEVIFSWIYDLRQMLINKEKEQDFVFMDGDFCFIISEIKGDKWHLQCAEEIPPKRFTLETNISIVNFLKAVVMVAKRIYKFYEQEKIGADELLNRRNIINQFENIINQKLNSLI